MTRQANDWSLQTPLDNTYASYNVFKSAYKNIRFSVATVSTYTVKEHDIANLPGIAYNVYNDTSYWHIILRFNGINDALQDVYAGLVLNMPDKAQVIAYISSQTNNTPIVITL